MIARGVTAVAEWLRLAFLAVRLVAGRRFWLAPLLPLAWSGFQILRLFVGWRPTGYAPADAQNLLIGIPLAALAAAFGVRVIAGELDRRTLEIAYTVPGGAHRVWLAKLGAAGLLLLVAEALLATVTFFFCTSFPAGALYGAAQAALFYMVLAMGLGVLFRSEATGAMLVLGVGILNIFAGSGLRVSPFWNPTGLDEFDSADVLAWTVQNRIGFLLVILAITALSFGRAERRERMLSG